MKRVWTFIHGIAIAFDYGIAMLVWFRVEDPMTVSSHAGLALRAGERWSLLAMLGRALNRIDTGHTDAAIAADIARCNASLRRLNG